VGTAPRLALFALAALAAFGAAFGVGRAVGPIDDDRPAERIEHVDPSSSDPSSSGHAEGHEEEGS
jgi:hypothetical protein